MRNKQLALKPNVLYSNRSRYITPPKYMNTKSTCSASPISYRGKDSAHNGKLKQSKSKAFMATADDNDVGERQEELYHKMMQDKHQNQILFKDLLFCI